MASSLLPDAQELLASITASSPEWSSWTTLLGLALEEVTREEWDAVVLDPGERIDATAPLLHGATFHVPARLARSWVQRLLRAAGDAGGPDAFALITASRSQALDSLALLQAGAMQDHPVLKATAEELSVQPDTLIALAQLAVMPILHGASARLSSIKPAVWQHSYCPVCGALPTLAELRGLERTRSLRCGRCGTDWAIDRLRCAYCRSTDQRRLGSLVPEEEGEMRKVDTCRDCGGYIKVLTTLRAWPPYRVPLEDLASVDLDLVALEHGFVRPDSGQFRLQVQLIEAAEKRRFFGLRG